MTWQTCKRKLSNGIYQCVALVVLSMFIAGLINAIRPDGLLWMQTRQNFNALNIESISPDEAWTLHVDSRIRFVDARSAPDYENGHLPGAINVPPHDMEKALLQLRIIVGSGMTLVTYCDGMDCTLGHELAEALKKNGIDAVKVLVDGWAGWYEAGYPFEKGTKHGAG